MRMNDDSGNYIEAGSISLSDPVTVARLIRERSALDQSCHEINLIYIDLIKIIEMSNLTSKQTKTVHLLMSGFSISEIAALLGCGKATVSVHFRRAIARITRRNTERWKTMIKSGEGERDVDMRKVRR